MKPNSPYKTFRFVSYAFDEKSGEAVLTYAFDDAVTLRETFQFPVPKAGVAPGARAALDRALFALHLVVGVSYYKAFCPPEIRVESGALTAEQAKFWNTLYTLGLGEFFYRNELSFDGLVNFPTEASAADGAPEVAGLADALVPIGGGKDSLVTVELMRASGRPFTLFTLGTFQRIQEAIRAIGEKHLLVHRKIDPTLFDLNAKGAYNGHVPISSIIAFSAVVTAILNGKRDIVLSNERSANFGNVTVGGVEVNHQYSKSFAFERDLQDYLARYVTGSVRYFSLLRPLSELAIAERFVKNGKYLDIFSSCNTNFRLRGTAPKERWCGQCPKCAFVFAMMAAFVPSDALLAMFGDNLFDRDDLMPLYQELLGCKDTKPFECVGEPSEVHAAFILAHRRGDLEETRAMRWYLDTQLPQFADPDAVVAEALRPSSEHAVPDEYAALINA